WKNLWAGKPTSSSIGFKETLSFFYCEYFKGLLFLSLSLLFVYAIPSIITKPGGISLMFNRIVKRGMDIFGALAGLVLTSPLWIILPILIKLDSKGSVFYTQSRVGINRRKQDRRLCQKVDTDDNRRRDRRRENYHGQTFKVIKFRTMVSDAEKKSGPVWATKNDKRVTRLGNFLRKTRMDEIPQFLNILKGDMSMVGPRPERQVFVADLSGKVDNYVRRLEIKPGLTGLAQITNGYDSSISSVADKVRHDIEYIDNWSIWSDIKIILKTVVVVFTRKGAQ
ncbi:MAG: sugar transferase, partial [candidate division Zixibacteria bacterium]|nr:sugar transferase [candidate division Zixibacteria bacterium]